MEMIRIIQRLSRGNAKLDFLASWIFLFRIMEIVCRNQPKSVFFGKTCQYRTDSRFFRKTVVLDFKEVVILAKRIDVEFNDLPCLIHIAIQDSLRHFPAYAGRCHDKAFMILFKELMIGSRAVVIAFRPCFRAYLDQILISFIIFSKQDQVGQFFLPVSGLVKAASPRDIDLTADNRLDSLLDAFLI